MVFPVDDVNDQLLYRGDAGNTDDNEAVRCGAGECEKIRKQKNGSAGDFIHSGMQRGETMKFQCRDQVSTQAHQHDPADDVPDPCGEDAPQNWKQPDNNQGIEKQVGDTVQFGPELTDGIGFSGDPAVQNVAEAAESVNDEKQGRQRSQKQKNEGSSNAYGGNAVWNIQFCGNNWSFQKKDLALSGDSG